MEQAHITQEELEQLHSIQKKHSEIAYELGILEVDKLRLEKRKTLIQETLQELEEETETLSQFLQEKYGKCSIDITTGAVIPVE